MPRKAPADYELIAQVYEETKSKAETARRLGLHYNTVYMGLRRLQGLCSRCGMRPANATKALCEDCRDHVNARETRHRHSKLRKGVCQFCSSPVDAPISGRLCRRHRLADAKRKREAISTGTRKPPDKVKVRNRNLRRLYGDAGLDAWERDNGTCQACGTISEKKKGMHLHHVDIDKTNNTVENLVVLCSDCHFLFHKILRHPNAGAVIAWATMTYPDFKQRFHDLAVLTSTPTGRSA